MSSARGAQNLTVYKYIRDLLNGCHYLCCVNIVRFDVCDVLLAIPSLNRQTSCLFTLKMFLFPHLREKTANYKQCRAMRERIH